MSMIATRNGAAATMAERASPPAMSGLVRRELDLLIRNFARFISSAVALFYQPGGKGQPPAVICSWGLGATHEKAVRLREGGFVGRALHLGAQRAALVPLHPLLDSSLVHSTDPPLSRPRA